MASIHSFMAAGQFSSLAQKKAESNEKTMENFENAFHQINVE